MNTLCACLDQASTIRPSIAIPYCSSSTIAPSNHLHYDNSLVLHCVAFEPLQWQLLHRPMANVMRIFQRRLDRFIKHFCTMFVNVHLACSLQITQRMNNQHLEHIGAPRTRPVSTPRRPSSKRMYPACNARYGNIL